MTGRRSSRPGDLGDAATRRAPPSGCAADRAPRAAGAPGASSRRCRRAGAGADAASSRRRARHAATALALAAEYRDDNTHEHTQRVGDARRPARARASGSATATVGLIRRAAPLHDLGKIAIPDSILLKPGKLTDEEFEVVKTHAVLGARVLADGGSRRCSRPPSAIARHHHERWDGGGYPDGLAGEAIPIAARIVHVADVFDVLVHERPYRDSLTWSRRPGRSAAGAGTQFDPGVVRAFDELGPAGWAVG